MLQRIQSLYMLLGALLTGLALWLDRSSSEVTAWISWTGWIIVLLLTINIFLFSNRSLQIKINLLVMMMLLIWIGLRVYDAVSSGGLSPEKDVPVLLPALVSIVLVKLAQSAIKRDENLVKSVDRIR